MKEDGLMENGEDLGTHFIQLAEAVVLLDRMSRAAQF